MHVLYGIVGALGLPFVYSFTQKRQNRFTPLIYAAVYLSLLGIVMRSFATG